MIRPLLLNILFPAWLLGSAAWAAPADPLQTARSYFAEAEYASAAKSFEEALRAYPSDPVVLNNLAVAKAAIGEHQAALDLLTRARQLAPHHPGIQENLNNLQEWSRNFGATERISMTPGNDVIPEPPPKWPSTATKQTNGRSRPARHPDCVAQSCK